MPRQRSIETLTKEHERYLRQCARAMPYTISIFVAVLAACSYATYKQHGFFWYALGILLVAGLAPFGDIRGYYFNRRKLKELRQ